MQNPDPTPASIKPYASATVFVGAGRAVQTVGNMVRTKVTALLLGTAGMGVVAQVFVFSLAYDALVTLALAPILAGTISRVRNARRDLRRTITTGGWLMFAAMVVAGTATVVFSAQLAELLLRDRALSFLFVLTGLAAPAVAIHDFGYSILIGQKKTRTVGFVVAVGGVVVVASAYPLIKLWGLSGAVVAFYSFYVGCAVAYVITLLRTRDPVANELRPFDRSAVSTATARLLVSDSSLNLLRVLLVHSSVLLVRGMIIEQLGADANGVFQAGFIVFSYIYILAGTTVAYILPRSAEVAPGRELSAECNNALRFLIAFFAPITLFAIVLRRPIILVLTSGEFLGADPLAAWLGLGRMFDVFALFFTTVLLARRRMVWFVGIEVVRFSTQIAPAVLLMPAWGLHAVVAGQVVGQVLAAIVCYVYLRRSMSVAFEPRLLRAGLTMVLAAWSAVYLPTGSALLTVLATAAAAAVCAISIGPRELVGWSRKGVEYIGLCKRS